MKKTTVVLCTTVVAAALLAVSKGVNFSASPGTGFVPAELSGAGKSIEIDSGGEKTEEVENDYTELSYDDAGKRLTVSGRGKMSDFSLTDRPEWDKYRDSAEHIVIGEGVTRVGNYAFHGFSRVKDVTVGNDVEEIGTRAFCDMDSLRTITLPDGLKKIEDGGIHWNLKLEEVNLPETLEYLGELSVTGDRLKSVTVPESVNHIGEGAFMSADEIRFRSSRVPRMDGRLSLSSSGVIYVPAESFKEYEEAFEQAGTGGEYGGFALGEGRWTVEPYVQ